MNPVKSLPGFILLATLVSAQPATVPTTVPPTTPQAAPEQAKPAAPQPQPAPATIPAQAAPAQPKPAAMPPAPAKSVPAPPVPPANVLFRPFFLTTDIAHYTGTAFRLRSESTNQHYLVTAHSLFSPVYGLDVQMSADDIARIIIAAVGVSCTDRSVVVVARPYVYIKDARATDTNGSEKDLALFRLPVTGEEPALTLDPAPPINGDRVWLYVKYAGTSKVGLEPATIAWTSDKEIRYLFENQTVDLRLMNGAPLLSSDSQVVGMHLATFTSKFGRLFGVACPASAIRAVIELPKREPKKLR